MLWTLGAFAQQVCKYDSTPATAPEIRFTDNRDGTVTDKVTGLQWKRCAEGQTWSSGTCTGTGTSHTWQEALQLASAANYAGHGDWRLANVKELASIAERACADPAIDLAVFPTTVSLGFWSASPHADNPSYAWEVSFHSGLGSLWYKDYRSRVRLVRGGQ